MKQRIRWLVERGRVEGNSFLTSKTFKLTTFKKMGSWAQLGHRNSKMLENVELGS